MKALILFLTLLLILTAAKAQSIPPLLNYQGRLTNPDGSPFPTADYELSIRIYDRATNGAVVWGPQIFDGVAGAAGHGAKVPVVQGYFNVVIGPADTNGTSLSDAFRGQNRYVEVAIDNRPPILPRQQILTTPYAFHAGDIADGVVTPTKLAARTLGTNVSVAGLAVSPTVSHVHTASVPTLVPGLEVRIETTGRPVHVFLSAGTGGPAFIEIYDSVASGVAQAVFGLWRSGSLVGEYLLEDAASGGVSHGVAVPSSSVQFLDTPPAGVHSYSIKMNMRPTNRDVRIQNSRLVAYEF